MTRPVDEIRRRLEARKQTLGACAGLARFLTAKGVCRQLAQDIAEGFFQKSHHMSKLSEHLIQRLNVKSAISLPTCLALVGPTGVGKTTTLLKLASFYTTQDARVVILNLDPQSSLNTIASKWGLPCLGPEDTLPEYDLLLIDTPGCNFYLPQRVEELGHLLTSCPDTHILLTLSAATKDVDVYGAIHQFSYLEPAGLIFTKLDETLAGGILLNVCQKTTLPLWYVAYGYPLPGKIELADAELIAKKILTDLNCEEFHHLRQLIVE